jgi:D-glycero-alpha-D-manno-heptose-7-phosphate kinase
MEREIFKECVGCQDQLFAAVGGFNVVEFKTTKDIVVNRVFMRPERMKNLRTAWFSFLPGFAGKQETWLKSKFPR